jgi:hypothetical protein
MGIHDLAKLQWISRKQEQKKRKKVTQNLESNVYPTIVAKKRKDEHAIFQKITDTLVRVVMALCKEE